MVRPCGRSRWFVVQADPGDPAHGPVVVVRGHTSQKAGTTALGRARGRSTSSADGQVVLQVLPPNQITSRLVWDAQAKRGVIQQGPPL